VVLVSTLPRKVGRQADREDKMREKIAELCCEHEGHEWESLPDDDEGRLCKPRFRRDAMCILDAIKVYKGGHLKDRLKRLGKIVLGGVCLIVGVVVIVDVWYMWAIALGGALIGFSYVWLWVNCREEQ